MPKYLYKELPISCGLKRTFKVIKMKMINEYQLHICDVDYSSYEGLKWFYYEVEKRGKLLFSGLILATDEKQFWEHINVLAKKKMFEKAPSFSQLEPHLQYWIQCCLNSQNDMWFVEYGDAPDITEKQHEVISNQINEFFKYAIVEDFDDCMYALFSDSAALVNWAR